MAFDGNGNWISNFSAVADRDANIKILASRFDDIFIADIAQSFENCLTKDAQVKPQQAFDANSYKVINVANPTNDYDAVNKQTLDNTLSTILTTLYPVGSVYIGTQNTCPLATLISGSTWTVVATKIVVATGNSIPVVGNGQLYLDNYDRTTGVKGTWTGRIDVENGGGLHATPTTGVSVDNTIGVSTDPAQSGVIADVSNATITVNVWKRTA